MAMIDGEAAAGIIGGAETMDRLAVRHQRLEAELARHGVDAVGFAPSSGQGFMRPGTVISMPMRRRRLPQKTAVACRRMHAHDQRLARIVGNGMLQHGAKTRRTRTCPGN
jgi:hypothetical protein